MEGKAGSSSSKVSTNPELEGLEGELQELVQQGQADAFLLYLLGLVLADRCARRGVLWKLHPGF